MCRPASAALHCLDAHAGAIPTATPPRSSRLSSWANCSLLMVKRRRSRLARLVSACLPRRPAQGSRRLRSLQHFIHRTRGYRGVIADQWKGVVKTFDPKPAFAKPQENHSIPYAWLICWWLCVYAMNELMAIHFSMTGPVLYFNTFRRQISQCLLRQYIISNLLSSILRHARLVQARALPQRAPLGPRARFLWVWAFPVFH
jgi:hypothetical protein